MLRLKRRMGELGKMTSVILVILLAIEVVHVGAQNVGQTCVPTDICSAVLREECDGTVCVCQSGYEVNTAGTQCTAVDCGTLAKPTNGNNVIYSPSTVYQSVAVFTCVVGYEVSGTNTRTCQSDKTWSGAQPTCVKKDCGALTVPTQGSIDNTVTTYGEVVTFTCETGYAVTGTAILTCTSTGAWSDIAPACTIVDCETLTQPTNGGLELPGTTYGQVATFSCGADYNLVGSTTRTCLASGLWSNSDPSCVVKDCGTLGTVTDGTISYSTGTQAGSTATVTCKTGYQLLGIGTLICLQTEEWSNSLPTCSIRDCGAAGQPAYGTVALTSGTTYDSTATFTCNTGYDRVGNSQIYCLATGAWDGTAPDCNIKDCGTLNAPANGALTYSTGTQEYGTTTTFTCNTGYTLVGSSTSTCDADGTWSVIEPVCTIKDCGTLAAPTNGKVAYSALYSYNSIAVFSCNLGYYLNGDAQRTCQSNAVWSGTTPFCNIWDCGSLDNPDNGQLLTTTGTSYSDTANFVCHTGYDMVGSAQLTCQAGGTWSDSIPVCNIRDCGSVAAPTDGSIASSTGTSFQQSITFACSTGYTLFGSVTIVCNADATWSGTTPTCQIKNCGTLVEPTSGSMALSIGTVFGSEATFTCDTGYSLSGDATLNCQAGGTWSNTEPTCDIVDCGSLTTPSNGVLNSPTTTYQSTATFTCNTGYTLNGSPSSVCQATGSWSNPVPTCVIRDCGGLTAVTNGVASNPSGVTTYQTTVTFTCNTGYTLFGSAAVTCQSDANWNTTVPVCNIQDCGQLTPPNNGGVSTTSGVTTYGAVATYTCNTGYQRNGATNRNCQADGTWSASAPTCLIVDCGPLPAPSFGSISTPGGTTYENVAIYACDLGYTRQGTSSRSCQADSSWSVVAPTCVINDCLTLAAPANGAVDLTGGTTYTEVATFSCNTGYTLDGFTTRTCQANSDWSDTSPVCNINNCGVLAAPGNGVIDLTDGTVYQSVASFDCNAGYDLTGAMTRTCQADSTWETPSPTCVIKDCLALTDPVDGLVNTDAGTTYLSVATYLCNAGYDPVGGTTRTCTDSGTWSSTAPTCTRKNCGVLEAPLNGTIDLVQGTLFEANATFACDTGFELTGTTTRTCLDTGNWGDSSPICVIKDCGALLSPLNGSVDTTGGVKYRDIATYSCDPGFTLTGDSYRVCQADAAWNGSAATCVIKDCGMLLDPSDGSVTYDPNTYYQGIATFTCNLGYTLNDSATRECIASGFWDAQSPGCDINDCGPLNSPNNGVVNQTEGTTYQSVSYFTCNIGYTLSGVTERTCQANSSWSDDSPVCIINDCGGISDPVNGTVDLTDGTVYQSVAQFICDTGFNLIGNATRECLAPGVWEMPFPYCEIKDCGVPAMPDFSFVNISGETTYLSKISYSCEDGFDLSGLVVRACESDGNWTDTDPECLRRDCGNLTAPDFGSVDYITGGTLFEDIAEYNCSLGFNLTDGTKYRICQADFVWNGTEPICITQDCLDPGTPTNGAVSTPGGTTFLQTAYYTCNTGYDLSGVATRTCQDSGGHPVWSDTIPTCIIKDCGLLVDPNDGSIDDTNGTTYKSKVIYSCITGYEVNGVATRVCESNGLWSGDVPTCGLKDCGTPHTVANGLYTTDDGTLYQATATYTCNTGYGLVGSATISCLSTGLWGSPPSCGLDCGTPPTVASATVVYTNGTLSGAKATYTCANGYSLSGGATITCNTTGTWSDEPFCAIKLRDFNETCFLTSQCITVGATCRDNGYAVDQCMCALQDEYYDATIDECLADCGDLPDPTNGLITLPSVTAAGQIVTYTCNVGYALSGNAVRTCQTTGVWSGSAPICITGCGSLDPPENGYVNTSNGKVSGKIAVYTCNTGYALVGSEERVCLDDSTWNGNSPVCSIECSSLRDIDHGTVDLALGHWEGSLAIYICDKDYALVGTSVRTCQGTGLWTGVPPECIFAIFPDILLVFGSLFIFLFIVDIAILSFCLYMRYCKPKKPEKPGDGDLSELGNGEDEEYPNIFDEKPPPISLPPMMASTNIRHSGRKPRNARISPDNTRYHPPPRKPKIDRPLYKYTVKPKTEISEPGLNQKPPGHLEPLKSSRELQLEDFGKEDALNSDDSAQRKSGSAPDDDQISLFDTPDTKWEGGGEGPRHGKAPTLMDEVNQHASIRARMSVPPVPDPPVPIQNESEKYYSEERRKYMKNSYDAYSKK